MCASYLTYRARSALGINRINRITVSQVLHATDTDIGLLRDHLRSWAVPNFQSFPLLLRALTHPSISNWAESVLELPRRSLASSTLELLGDSVVGTCAAHSILSWARHPTPPALNWAGGPRIVFRTFIGNRGMATTARDMGVEALLRWEKPLPPAPHRLRLNRQGVDVATGFQSNVEVNALAAAFESIAASIYLDGGHSPTLDFVNATLLQHPLQLQLGNQESSDYERQLSRELAALVGFPVSVISARKSIKPDSSSAHLGNVQAEVLDLQQEVNNEVNAAHVFFYAGVAIGPTSSTSRVPDEYDIISLASHFSVETARIVALRQALALLRGEVDVRSDPPDSRVAREDRVCLRRGANCGPCIMKVKVNDLGMWQFDSDYEHVGGVLSRAGVPGFEDVNGLSASDVRSRLRSKWELRMKADNEELENMPKSTSSPALFPSTKTAAHNFEDRPAVRSHMEAGMVEDFLRIGQDIQAEEDLHKEYESLSRNIRSADDVVSAVGDAVSDLNGMDRSEYVRILNGYHILGRQTVRLWAVQRSIRSVSQDRAEIVPMFEQRLGLAGALERNIIGKDGLIAGTRVSGVRMWYVALGMCVERLGAATAIAWLTGAEEKLRSHCR